MARIYRQPRIVPTHLFCWTERGVRHEVRTYADGYEYWSESSSDTDVKK
jgi:hypothetical protein